MAFFLNDNRRAMLVRNLCHVGLPRILAENHACISDTNLKQLDRTMSAVVWRIQERTSRLDENVWNKHQTATLQLAITADLLIFGSYAAECNERGLSKLDMPRTNVAVAATLRTIDHTKALILAALGKRGVLQ